MRHFLVPPLLILLIALTAPTISARILQGTVTDNEGEVVSFASIVVAGSQTGCMTDEKGVYRLEIPDSSCTVNVSCVGFETLCRHFSTGKKNLKADFTLKPNSSLSEVTIFGKNKRRKMLESEYNVNAIDVASAINTSANLSDLVNRSAGVRIRATGGLGSDFDVSLNGLTGSAVRYFVDGIPMETLGSNVTLANLPVNTVERIDIYKGVVPAFLGTDAMGGAVNIITRQDKKKYVDVSVSAGSFHTYAADFSAQCIEPTAGIIIRPSVSYKYSKNDYTMKGVEVWDKEADKYRTVNRKRFHDDYRSVIGRIEAGVEHKKWAKTLFFTGSYSDVDKEVQTGSVQAIVYGAPRRKGHTWSIGGRYSIDNLLTSGLNLNLNISHSWDRSQTIDTVFRKYDWNGSWIPAQRNEISGGAKSIRHYIRPLTSARANLEYRFGEIHTLNLSYSLNRTGNKRYDDLDEEFDPSKDILSKHITGLSYNQSLINDRMLNTLFVKNYTEQLKIIQLDERWNSNTKESSTKTFWGYGFASRMNILEPLQVKASFEHSVRLPLSREMLGNGTTVYANLALNPENADNVNLGIFGTIHPDRDNTVYYEVSGYFRHVNDMIHLVTNENTGLSQYGNISSVNIHGLEGEIGYHYSDKFHLTTNWSWSVSKDMNRVREDGKPSVTYKNRIPNLPWLYGNSELTYLLRNVLRPADRIRMGYIYSYVHWFYLTWAGYGSLSSKSKIPTQNDHNVYVTYSWDNERYNITAELDNIFDATLYDNYKLQKPGRSVMFKFHLFLQ